jgi:PleD family two-component response regulator
LSQPKNGSLRLAPSGAHRAEAVTAAALRVNSEHWHRKQPYRLLIVDDSALMRKVTHLAFPATKFEVEEAENGFGALAQLSLAKHPSDAIGAHGHPWR